MRSFCFDRKDAYTEHIESLVKELSVACRDKGILFFFAACTENTPDETSYLYEANMPEEHEIELTDDKLAKFLSVILGFNVTPPRDEIEIMMPDFEDADEE